MVFDFDGYSIAYLFVLSFFVFDNISESPIIKSDTFMTALVSNENLTQSKLKFIFRPF